MPTLDIDPLRSFVAVSAFCGVRRAAAALHLSPATVTGHLRRLEHELGCALVTRQGRAIALTADGEELAARARILLETHDETVRALLPPGENELVIASTEYVVDSVVPTVVNALRIHLPQVQMRFRFTRSAWVRDMARTHRADVGLALANSGPGAVDVGALPLQWVGVPDAPRNRLVAYTLPCSVRHLALPALPGPDPQIVRECRDITSLLSAVRRGEGVAAIPFIDAHPTGLTQLTDMPPLPQAPLYAVTGPRISPIVRTAVISAIRQRLGT